MTEQPTVVQALTAVMAEVQAVGKGQRNTEQGYNFRGVDAVVNAVGPVLRKHGVVVLPMLEEANHRDVLTSRDKKSRESTVKVRYRFYGPAGDSIDAVVPGEAMDFGDKGVAKAMSVAYRIVLLQALCIPTDEPDPDAQVYERAGSEGSPEAIDLFAAIVQAADEPTLRKAWESVTEARNGGRITEREAAQLNAHVKRRKAELEAPDDGTGDGHGGGPEPGPAGEGPGPDSPGAGVGGPAGDGTAGGGGPGVQPGVHNRDRGGRPPQASGNRRDTPAAVGG
jgi:hypothetical protein